MPAQTTPQILFPLLKGCWKTSARFFGLLSAQTGSFRPVSHCSTWSRCICQRYVFMSSHYFFASPCKKGTGLKRNADFLRPQNHRSRHELQDGAFICCFNHCYCHKYSSKEARQENKGQKPACCLKDFLASDYFRPFGDQFYFICVQSQDNWRKYGSLARSS